MTGKEVPNPLTSIRMFALCSAMKWAHLPVPGGIYAQNPDMMDQFRYIFQEQAKEQEKERKRNEREAKNKTMRHGAARPR